MLLSHGFTHVPAPLLPPLSPPAAKVLPCSCRGSSTKMAGLMVAGTEGRTAGNERFFRAKERHFGLALEKGINELWEMTCGIFSLRCVSIRNDFEANIPICWYSATCCNVQVSNVAKPSNDARAHWLLPNGAFHIPPPLPATIPTQPRCLAQSIARLDWWYMIWAILDHFGEKQNKNRLQPLGLSCTRGLWVVSRLCACTSCAQCFVDHCACSRDTGRCKSTLRAMLLFYPPPAPRCSSPYFTVHIGDQSMSAAPRLWSIWPLKLCIDASTSFTIFCLSYMRWALLSICCCT